MPKSTATTDPMDAWRKQLTQAERDWNQYFNEAMGSDAFSQVMGTWMNGFLTVQKNTGEAVERYLAGFNLPTRSDITEISERLTTIEERLRRIEAATAGGPAKPRNRTPPRTRKPPSENKSKPATGSKRKTAKRS